VETPIQQVINQVSVGQPQIPVISARGATPVEACTPGQLLDTMRCRVDFTETVRNLERDGPCHYVDLGPSGSMATTVKYNLDESSHSQITTVITRFGQEARNLERLFKHLDTA
jgi:acyl transferase domain-containing protein